MNKYSKVSGNGVPDNKTRVQINGWLQYADSQCAHHGWVAAETIGA
jgi:hypothetical protein